MRSIQRVFGLLLALTTLAPASVLQIFDARPSWEAATTGRTNIDFDSLGLGGGGYTSYSTSSGLTTGGVQFVGVVDPNTYFLYALNPVVAGDTDADFGSATLLKGPYFQSTAYLKILLPSAVTAFGLDLMTYSPAAQSFRIKLDNVDVGGAAITTSLRPNRTFFGVTTNTPVTEVSIILDSGTINQTLGLFDNVSYGAALTGPPPDDPPAETPEVATMFTVGAGLLAMRWLRRPATMPAA